MTVKTRKPRKEDDTLVKYRNYTFAPKHAGAPLITPTRIFVAPKTEAPVDAVIMMGICLLVEFMMAPIDAEEPPQLRAFWSEVGVCCRV